MTEKRYFYQNRTFSVEDNLFYENNTRIGYFEDEEKEEILKNNHKAVVDRFTDLRDSNIYLKRSNKKIRKEKEDWKNNCLQSVSENNILWNEIFILMEQGAEPSNAFKNYLNGLKNKNKKLKGDLE